MSQICSLVWDQLDESLTSVESLCLQEHLPPDLQPNEKTTRRPSQQPSMADHPATNRVKARKNVFPCGFCERDLSLSHSAVCCDACDISFHRSFHSISVFSFLSYETRPSNTSTRSLHSNTSTSGNSPHRFNFRSLLIVHQGGARQIDLVYRSTRGASVLPTVFSATPKWPFSRLIDCRVSGACPSASAVSRSAPGCLPWQGYMLMVRGSNQNQFFYSMIFENIQVRSLLWLLNFNLEFQTSVNGTESGVATEAIFHVKLNVVL